MVPESDGSSGPKWVCSANGAGRRAVRAGSLAGGRWPVLFQSAYHADRNRRLGTLGLKAWSNQPPRYHNSDVHPFV